MPLHLDIENCSLRFSVIGYYGSLAFTAFTFLSTTDPCISLCGDVRESVERVFQPLPLNNEFVILRFLWCVDHFPNPFLKFPLGMFIFNIYLMLVLCGYFLPVSGLPFIALVEVKV